MKIFAYKTPLSNTSICLEISKADNKKLYDVKPDKGGAYIFDHNKKRRIFVQWANCGADCFCALEIKP